MRKSDKEIEDAANSLRSQLELQKVDAPAMFEVLSEIEDAQYGLKVTPRLNSDMGEDEAWFNSSTRTLAIRESILHEAKMGKGRARFTIAHELGHFILGHEGNPRRNPDTKIYLTAESRIVESEANKFASFFLVPTKLAWNATAPQEIEARFQVSSKAAELAFDRVQKAKRLEKGETRRSPQVVIDFLKEQEKRGYKVKSKIDFEDE